jgi:glycosyltransferase involved in cell wall biosynthesis
LIERANVRGRPAVAGLWRLARVHRFASVEPRQSVPAESGERPVSARRRRPRVLFLWESFGPHHVDRCAACVEALGSRYDIYGIEIATFDANYQWRGSVGADSFPKITLFPGVVRQKLPTIPCFLRILATCLKLNARYVFLCNYDVPSIFLSAVALRLLARRVFIMQDSKFDDKQRYLAKEMLKGLLYRPYQAAVVAGQRAKGYLAFLGIPEERIFIGYDTVSTARIRRAAESDPAPGGVPHRDRHFTIVARFVPKKNLSLALEAYGAYLAHHPDSRRELHLCGSGPLEDALRSEAARLGLSGVRFRGYLQEDEIARILASTLALILPSVEEQHGLVINEAIAMGVPVLISDNCGARDLLVRSAVNGYIFEPDNAEGLAHFMGLLDRDATEWQRLAKGTRLFAAAADTGYFVQAIDGILRCFAGQG